MPQEEKFIENSACLALERGMGFVDGRYQSLMPCHLFLSVGAGDRQLADALRTVPLRVHCPG
jgi:hypothetical protein